MRTNFLCAVMMLGTVVAAGGCTASARIGSEAKEPAPAAEPPKEEEKKVTVTDKTEEKKEDDFKFDKQGALMLPGPVVFETGKDILKPESDEVLTVVKKYLDAKPQITLLRIEGHTDTDGDDRANQKLSEARSMAVARWLVAKGVDCKRVIPVGFGEGKPIAPNDTPDNKAQNRRTSFINAAIKGKAIGGMPVDGGGQRAGDPCQ